MVCCQFFGLTRLASIALLRLPSDRGGSLFPPALLTKKLTSTPILILETSDLIFSLSFVPLSPTAAHRRKGTLLKQQGIP
jgi:hypothetical protein